MEYQLSDEDNTQVNSVNGILLLRIYPMNIVG